MTTIARAPGLQALFDKTTIEDARPAGVRGRGPACGGRVKRACRSDDIIYTTRTTAA